MSKLVAKFLFQNKLILTEDDIALLPSEANIHLKVDLFGGRSSADIHEEPITLQLLQIEANMKD